MCGIIAGFHFGGKSALPVNKFVMNQLQEQLTRGKEGFGMVQILPEGVEVLRSTELTKAYIDLYMNPSMAMMFHHRFPTSTPNKLGQTHPIVVAHESLKSTFLVIHNGVISGPQEARTRHEAAGFTYTTLITIPGTPWGHQTSPAIEKFNDTEALAIELALFIEGKSKLIDVRGSAAFVVLEMTKDWKPLRVHFGRNDANPLLMSKSQNHLYLSSEKGQHNGNMVTPLTLYSANLADPLMNLTKKSFKMAAPLPLPAYTPKAKDLSSPYSGYTGVRSDWYCSTDKCYQGRITGSISCATHQNVLQKSTTTEIPTKGPMGFQSERERQLAALPAGQVSVEAKEEAVEKGQEEDDRYVAADEVLQEFFDILRDGEIPDAHAYGALMTDIFLRTTYEKKMFLRNDGVPEKSLQAFTGELFAVVTDTLEAEDEMDRQMAMDEAYGDSIITNLTP